mmetsp:Transcript_54443/g.127097  ORF Transcript_54443/g.127097 Transcript_54443/m.127097 type:complete len:545 (+) Transcript_54443:130-1764(+)
MTDVAEHSGASSPEPGSWATHARPYSAGNWKGSSHSPFAVRRAQWPSQTNGAEMMENFLQQHLTAILHPIAEHVKELQNAVKQLNASMRDASAEATYDREKLSGHDQALAACRQEMLQALEQLRAEFHAGDVAILEGHAEQLGDLSKQQGKTGVALQKVDHRLEKAEAAVNVLRKALEESNAERHEGDLKLWQAQLQGKRLEEALPSLLSKQASLEEDYRDFRSNMLHARAMVDKMGYVVNELPSKASVEECMKAATEAAKTFTSDNERYASLENSIGAVRESVDGHNRRLADIEVRAGDSQLEIRRLQVDLELIGVQTGKENNSMERLGELETALVGVKKDLDFDTDRGKRLEEAMKDAGRKIQKNAMEIRQQEQVIAMVHKDAGACQQQVTDFASRVPQLEKGHQAAGDQLVTLAAKLNDLTDLHSAVEIGLAQQQTETEKALFASKRLNRDLDSACATIKMLQEALEQTNDDVARVAGHLDLAHDYLHGISKGVQDTHQKVSLGQDGLLPPKAERRTLPALPAPKPKSLVSGTAGTPRTAS